MKNVFDLRSVKHTLSYSKPRFLPNKVVVRINEITHLPQDAFDIIETHKNMHRVQKVPILS